MYARTYAQILGVVLILVGLVGLALGNQVWGGILNVDIAEDIVHLITGGLLAFVGFGRTDLSVTRNVVGLLGIVYLLVSVLGFAAPTMFGLIPHGYTAFDNLLHLVLGGLSLAVGWWLFGGEGEARTQNQAEEPEEL